MCHVLKNHYMMNALYVFFPICSVYLEPEKIVQLLVQSKGTEDSSYSIGWCWFWCDKFQIFLLLSTEDSAQNRLFPAAFLFWSDIDLSIPYFLSELNILIMVRYRFCIISKNSFFCQFTVYVRVIITMITWHRSSLNSFAK